MGNFFGRTELEKAIHACWGGFGAHAEVFNDMKKEISTLRAENERMRKTLGKIELACAGSWVNVAWISSAAREALATRGQEGEG